jgi:hypothetical protein
VYCYRLQTKWDYNKNFCCIVGLFKCVLSYWDNSVECLDDWRIISWKDVNRSGRSLTQCNYPNAFWVDRYNPWRLLVRAAGIRAEIWRVGSGIRSRLHVKHAACGSVVVKALRYEPEGRGFEARWGQYILWIHLILPAALGPGVHSAYNRNEYQKQKINVSWE